MTDEALAAFERSTNILPSVGTNSAAVLETAARVRLAQGRLDDCEQLLRQINEMIRTQTERFSYGHREAALTRAKLLASKGLYASAIVQCDDVSVLADGVKDDWLHTQALFSKAEFMVRLERRTDALALIDDSVGRLLQEPVDLFAQYERLLGTALIPMPIVSLQQHTFSVLSVSTQVLTMPLSCRNSFVNARQATICRCPMNRL